MITDEQIEMLKNKGDKCGIILEATPARVAELEQVIADERECRKVLLRRLTVVEAERDRLRDKNAQYRDVLEEISEGFGYPGNARTPEELSANQMMQMAEAALAASKSAMQGQTEAGSSETSVK